ncbi:MAG TPA: hypothetical protein PKY77_21885 [Phycisphaerae bacterium]|nr:hypothetical protein [Phycisphaerae bacterium]HRY69257.1 hypothetical protein [Phycisphaerae bacterium]HSA26575.1 hypothetical protein [Phycisphaerae bacterium]
MRRFAASAAITLVLVAGSCPSSVVLANGGPFVVKYPEGDPAAKGVLAPLTNQLKPGREERLKVLKEDLELVFVSDRSHIHVRAGGQEAPSPLPPLVVVSAAYTIENPTDKDIEVAFGFPILRGLYMSPFSMMPHPDAQVRLNNKDFVHSTIISNSAIYGMIREQARRTIEEAIAKDDRLSVLVAQTRATGWVRQRVRAALRTAAGEDGALRKAVNKDALVGDAAAPVAGLRESDHEAARTALREHAASVMKWDKSSAGLLVEYASLDWGSSDALANPPDRPYFLWGGAVDSNQWVYRNLGPLSAIGEQKATQLFATLAARFDQTAASTYESIFSSWGGDVRERSVDLTSGTVRPREITVSTRPASEERHALRGSDPTVYARVDYLDPNARTTEAEKDSCRSLLGDLPVVFTFAPMNLIQYQVRFPAKATQVLTVSYKQYAYKDTHEPASYQFAYVLHPASMWRHFGPIHLKVGVPAGTPFKASVACETGGVEEYELPKDVLVARHSDGSAKDRYTFHRATLRDKTGELFLAVGAAAMDQRTLEPVAAQPPAASSPPGGGGTAQAATLTVSTPAFNHSASPRPPTTRIPSGQ